MRPSFRTYRAALGPIEQAQIVASTAVVVSMITIVAVRLLGNYQLEWFDFTSITIVGVFGFLIVYFTLKYGRLLEEQKKEILALKNVADAINRNTGMDFILQTAARELQQIIEIDEFLVYLNKEGILTLAFSTGELQEIPLLPGKVDLQDPLLENFKSSKIHKLPIQKNFESPKGYRSLASVPISSGSLLSGLVVIASIRHNAFTRRYLELLNGFATQIGVALDNATLISQLKDSEERYLDLFEHAPDMYYMVNRDGDIVDCNITTTEILGYSKEDLLGTSLFSFYPPSARTAARELLDRIFFTATNLSQHEEQLLTKSGRVIEVSSSTSLYYGRTGEARLVRWVSRDITEKKKLESTVFHAQRIDSIGSLAGGVAHDFNNILTSILGSVSILKTKPKSGSQIQGLIELIETAAMRGSSLTRQLLTFARKDPVAHRPISIASVVGETIDLFERSVRKTIIIERYFRDTQTIIKGDEGQIQQAILNLLINARDALRPGGKITVESKLVSFSRPTPNRFFGIIKPGQYVEITVYDDGIGIDDYLLTRIFEPFFTTKDPGKGTGLGLSVVYGVVKAHGGFIDIESTPHQGTSVRLYIPALILPKRLQEIRKTPRRIKGKGTILIIDDEKSVTTVLKTMAESLGYQVTATNSSKRGIQLLKKYPKRYDLLILDLNMPQPGGKDIILSLQQQKHRPAIVVSTGYGEGTEETMGIQSMIEGFIQKPFQAEELSVAIHNALKTRRNS